MIKIPMEVFSHTNEAAVVARGGRLIYANGAAKELLGADCEGKCLSALLGPDISEAQASSFVAGYTRGGRQYSVRATRQDSGQFFFFSEQEARPTVLNEAALYSLRSNLMTMNLALELCRNKAENMGNQELLDGLRELCRGQYRMSRLSSNLSMLNEEKNGEMSFQSSTVDIGRLCMECVECVESLTENIEFRVAAEEGILLTADAALVKKMLLNLISNCLLHARGLSRISVNVINSPDFVQISVSDDGCGIAGEQLYRVFDRYRHMFDVTEMDGGAGIGLSVVRLIAQRHGGTLLIESREGSGTTARVSLKKIRSTTMVLHSGPEEHFDVATALIELSDCLDSRYYGEKFMD